MLNIFVAEARARVASHCSSITIIRLLGAPAPTAHATTAPAPSALFRRLRWLQFGRLKLRLRRLPFRRLRRLRLRQFRPDGSRGSSSDRSCSDGYDSGSGGSGGSLWLWRFSPAPIAPFMTALVAPAPKDMAPAAPAVPALVASVL
jgi:hypothetical protein